MAPAQPPDIAADGVIPVFYPPALFLMSGCRLEGYILHCRPGLAKVNVRKVFLHILMRVSLIPFQ
jgi:hypothetical protein